MEMNSTNEVRNEANQAAEVSPVPVGVVPPEAYGLSLSKMQEPQMECAQIYQCPQMSVEASSSKHCLNTSHFISC